MPLVKGAKLVVYNTLRRKPKRPHKLVAAAMHKIKIWEIEFPTESLAESMGFWSRRAIEYRLGLGEEVYDMNSAMSNPKSKIALWFEGGKKECGLEPFKWYIMVNNRIFRRITYRDLGKKNAKSGLHVKRDGKCSIYLEPMKIGKKDKARIMSSLGISLVEG